MQRMGKRPKKNLYAASGADARDIENGIEIKKTICAICNPHTHCGIDAHVRDGRVIKVEGSKAHPHSEGTLCSKGSASRQYIYHKDRIHTPLMRKGNRGSGEFVPITWDEAMDRISHRLLKLKKEHGPESVIFFAGFTKWFRPFLKRLAYSFGSPNYASESSTCHNAAKLATLLNFGAFGGPDVKNTRCLIVWSCNPFYTNTPIVSRLLDAKERGLKIIEVGPLLTPMTGHADIHLRIRPGTSGALALGIARVIINEGLYDRAFVEKWTEGFEEYKAYADAFTPEVTERITGVTADLMVKAARLYAETRPAAMMTSASPTTHHTNGVQNHRALTALVGLTGNYDKPGGNYVIPPSWLYVSNGVKTRQAEFEQSRPWEDMAPRVGADTFPVWMKMIPEAQAMRIPFQIRSKKPYPLRAMVGFGMNYKMWPGCDFMLQSLQKLDFIVNADLFMTQTAKWSDIILPACTSFERSELKFWAENHVMWTQPVIEPLGESRSDAEIIFDLAARIAPDDALMKKGYEACINWILKPADLTVAELKKHPGGIFVTDAKMPPYKKYEKSGFRTPSGKMEFVSGVLKEAGLDPLPVYREPELSPHSRPEAAKNFPLILTTGARLPMYQHSRTFRVTWTRRLHPSPTVDINPIDAATRGISTGDSVSLSTPRASIVVRTNITAIVPPGVVSIYHAWPEVDVNILMEPDYLDPISGFPGFKSLICEVKKMS
ncbi:MAG: molybdopterin-dependent oxidoreductase [Deltaproteobacteria bacterium]|nr:molybdopterin-dependent oxidoreductase [Deltaproteobacteria bacterium]